MRIIKKIPSIEVKRSFVTAQKIRYSRQKKLRYLPKLSRKEFLSKIQNSKNKVNLLSEKQLDKIIGREYKNVKKRIIIQIGI